MCEPAPLTLADVLCDAGEVMRHVYFPLEGSISLTVSVDGHPGIDVGTVGCEGVLGASLTLGVRTAPLRALVRVSGHAMRIRCGDLQGELTHNTALRESLQRHVYLSLVQVSSAAACLRHHLVGARLARALLMIQDRVRADRFRVTQELLARMLGVRRVGVTEAAGALQRAALVAYRRGDIEILDRRGLEAVACSCYAADKRAYARWFD